MKPVRACVMTVGVSACAFGLGSSGVLRAGSDDGAGTQAVAGTLAGGTQMAQGTREDSRSEAIVIRVCGGCHVWERIGDSRRTRAQWEELIDDMIGRGAAASDDDYKAILEYALRRYALVNVNKAPAEDLALVLGLLPTEADAIVAYRTANGKIPDFESLKKVGKIDQKKLEAARLAILY